MAISSTIVAAIPDLAVRRQHADRLPDTAWADSSQLAALMEPYTAVELVRRAKGGPASLAEAMARVSTDSEFLSELFSKDRRIGVRGRVLRNPATPPEVLTDFILGASSSPENTDDIVCDLSTTTILTLLADPRVQPRLLSPNLRRGRRRVATVIAALSPEDWPDYLAAAPDLSPLGAVVDYADLTFDQAVGLIDQFSTVLRSTRSGGDRVRSSIADRCLTSGTPEDVIALQQRTGWYEIAERVVSTTTWEYTLADFTLEPERRFALGLVMLDRGRALTRDLTETLCLGTGDLPIGSAAAERAWQTKWQDYHLRRQHKCSVDDAAVDYIADCVEQQWDQRHVLLGAFVVTNGTVEQVGRLLNHHNHEFVSAVLNTLNTTAWDYLSGSLPKLLTLLDPRSTVAAEALLTQLPSVRRHSTEVGVAVQALRQWGPVLRDQPGRSLRHLWESAARTGEGIHALWELLTDGHPTADPGTNPETATAPDARIGAAAGDLDMALLAVILRADWWNNASAEDDPFRQEILTRAEQMAGNERTFWEYYGNGRHSIPALLFTAGSGFAQWMVSHTPQAVAAVNSLIDTTRFDFVPGVARELVPYGAHPWGAWHREPDELVAAFLAEHLSGAEEWEVALGLLPEWNGTLVDLVNAARQLSSQS